MCKCGFKNLERAKFCSECGMKLIDQLLQIPQMLTVKDVYEKIFFKKVSLATIYNLVRTKSIPHCKVNERILFDYNNLIEWWEYKNKESSNSLSLQGLRKII